MEKLYNIILIASILEYLPIKNSVTLIHYSAMISIKKRNIYIQYIYVEIFSIKIVCTFLSLSFFKLIIIFQNSPLPKIINGLKISTFIINYHKINIIRIYPIDKTLKIINDLIMENFEKYHNLAIDSREIDQRNVARGVRKADESRVRSR